jgi:hypothetical protein
MRKMFRRTDLIKELRDTPASFPIQHATSCKKKYPVRSRETLNDSQLLSAYSHPYERLEELKCYPHTAPRPSNIHLNAT